MKSFTLPITSARNLISKIGSHFLIENRKDFHRPVSRLEDLVEFCQYCHKPLSTISDPLIGNELVCESRSCPGR